MSRETFEWLNTQTLIGFTGKRGNAWHYRSDMQGDESNHYDGPVPIADVQRRLFDWQAVEMPVMVPSPALSVDQNGQALWIPGGELRPVDGRKAIVRSDNGAVMGIFSDGYQPHQYSEWLIDNVANILDADLSIGSAGLLKGGAVAWVSVEVPDSITTPEGVEFRPNLIATTSFDGTIATTYKRVVTNVVCDNTMALALAENGQQFKVRHSSRSMSRLTDARQALAVVHSIAEEFEREVKELCAVSFSDMTFERLVDFLVPLKNADGTPKEGRGATMAEKKRNTLWNLWVSDQRVHPWQGTAFGAWQALNTYDHHFGNVKEESRPARNMLRAIDGKGENSDRDAVRQIMELVA